MNDKDNLIVFINEHIKSGSEKLRFFNLLDKYTNSLQLRKTDVSTCFLEDVTDDVFNMVYKQVTCCKIAPITDENYCPKCGKKILK